MFRFIEKIIKINIVRNVLIVATGSVGAQALSMAFTPLITRLYGPEAFGVFGAFMAIVGIIAPVVTMAYPIAIILPKSDNEAIGIIRISILINCVVSFFCFCIILFAGEVIVLILGLEKVSNYLMLIPLFLFITGIQQILQQWTIRKNKFILNSKASIAQSLFANLSKVSFGYISSNAFLLIFLSWLAQLLYIIYLWMGCLKIYSSKKIILKRKIKLKFIAIKYKDFPRYRAPEIFIDALSQGLPVLLIMTFSGSSYAGFFVLARTVVSLPSLIIGNAIGNVIYPKINEISLNKKDIYEFVKKATFLIGVIGILPFGSLIIFGPWMFSLVFGSEWASAGEYARWLSVWMFFAFFNTPAVQALVVMGEQKFYLQFSLLTSLFRMGFLLFGVVIVFNDVLGVALFSIVGAAANFYLLVSVMKKLLKKRVSNDC